jgi:TatD DNase family protein
VTLIDTHCHLNLDQFESDREAVLERAAQAGLDKILVPGLDLASSRAAVQLAASHSMLFAAVGIHPTEAGTWRDATKNELRALISPSPLGRGAGGLAPRHGGEGEGKIVAIGEIGLDDYWESTLRKIQVNILKIQLELAAETGLPVILHMREARHAPAGRCAGDLLKILSEWVNGMRSDGHPLADRPGVWHSFSGTLEAAREAILLGFYIGVTGSVTYKNAGKRQEILSALPLERILLETDAPFQTPHPYRGKRNEPAYIRLIADKIALIHSCSLEQVAEVTGANARRLFAWKETG